MRVIVVWLAILLLLAAIVAGYGLASKEDPHGPEALAWAERTRQETADAARWRAAWQPVGLVLAGAFGAAGILALGVAVVVAYRWGDRKARTVYPDASGIMPAVVLKPGEVLVDAGALAGPMVAGPRGCVYSLPPGTVAALQETANRGAAATRMMRAWATRDPGRQEATAPPWPLPAGGGDLPPVEVLTGDEAHIYRLLEDGNHAGD